GTGAGNCHARQRRRLEAASAGTDVRLATRHSHVRRPKQKAHQLAPSGGVLHDYLLSVFLGIVEGLTEFLPVSSTAHLRITEKLFSLPLDDPFWKMYSIVIQLGAILCLPIYFRARIGRFLSTFPRGEPQDRTALTHPLTLVMIAFVCTAVPSLLL